VSAVEVTLVHHVSKRKLGRVNVPSVDALRRLATMPSVTLEVAERVHTYRIHGYEWHREGDAVVGTLFVEP